MEKHLMSIIYNVKTDSFDLFISENNGKTWGLRESFKCSYSIEQAGTINSPEFIHFSALTEINKLAKIGYKYYPKDGLL